MRKVKCGGIGFVLGVLLTLVIIYLFRHKLASWYARGYLEKAIKGD